MKDQASQLTPPPMSVPASTKPALPAIDFGDSVAVVEALKAKHAHLPEVVDEKTRKEVTAGITEFKSARSKIEKKRKDLKAASLDWQRQLDGEARRVTALFEEAEAVLISKRQPYDDKIASEKRRKEEERLAAERAEQERIEAEREAERQRLEAQRLEQEAREKALREQEAELRRQQELHEATQRAAKEAREQAEREFQRKQEAERLEQQRREQEAETKRIAEEKALAMAPDKEKMAEVCRLIDELGYKLPGMASIEGKEAISKVRDSLSVAFEFALSFSGSMEAQ